MKNQQNTTPKWFGSRVRRWTTLLKATALATGLGLCHSTQAQINLLANPGGETGDFSGWTVYNNLGYNMNTVTNIGSADIIPPHTGNYAYFIYGAYNADNQYNGMYQKASAHPGQVFTADGWVYQIGSDSFAGGGNNAFLEVTFLDINSTTLARYRSASIIAGSPTDMWVDMQVTNQLDVNTYATTGSVTTLVAPAGTVQVEYNLVFNLVNYAGGSTYWDDLSLISYSPPPPYITNVAPAVVMATNDNLTFTAVAQSGTITNIQLTVTAVKGLVNSQTNTTTYTATSPELTISGLNTASANVSFPLDSNTTYTVTILATDSNEGTALANASFDTIRPVLLWEAEDFNFDGGQFIPTPSDGGTALYAGKVGVEGIDEHKIGGAGANGGGAFHFYRPDDAVSIQAAGELPRQKFIDGIAAGNTNAIDEEVGYNSVGDWINFTRVFPAGDYNIYARLATVGSGAALSLGLVTSDPTAYDQTVTTLGTFSFSGNAWNVYKYVPLTDSFGNLVTVHLDGQQTLRSTVIGNPNISFFMLMPATGSPYPALLSSYPTGLHPFEPTNRLTFSIGPASGNPINTGDIHLTLNGQDVSSQVTFTAGDEGSWNASIAINTNAIYSAVINVTNTASLKSTFTINFDTFSEDNFSWEAEDFDFNGGQFIDNPVPTGDNGTSGGILDPQSYYGYPEGNPANVAIFGVDFTMNSSADGASFKYRPFDDCGTEYCADYLRQKFLDSRASYSDPDITDFDVGWWNPGWWLNYTRTYPSGKFYIYGRLAGGGAFSGTTVSLVSGDTTNVIGSFADPNADGWQSWHWVLLRDTNNNPASVTLNGVSTLRVTSNGGLNANFYMLVPAVAVPVPMTLTATISGAQPAVSFPTQDGFTYTLLYKDDLTETSWHSLSGVAGGQVTGDGSTKTLTDATATGVAHRFYQVQVQ